MDAMKGLSSDTIEKLTLEIEDNTFLWDKAQNYKDQALKEVTWSRIGGNDIIELHIEQHNVKVVADDFKKREKRHKDVEPIEMHPVTPIEKYIKVEPSPKPVPRTTAQQIGWRSGQKLLALDKYGKYANPKGGLIKQLNWPTEAIS